MTGNTIRGGIMLSTKEALQIINEIINEVAGYEATRDAFEHYVMRRFFERFVVSDYEVFEFSNSSYIVIKCYDGMLRVEFSPSGGVEVKSYIPPTRNDKTLKVIEK